MLQYFMLFLCRVTKPAEETVRVLSVENAYAKLRDPPKAETVEQRLEHDEHELRYSYFTNVTLLHISFYLQNVRCWLVCY